MCKVIRWHLGGGCLLERDCVQEINARIFKLPNGKKVASEAKLWAANDYDFFFVRTRTSEF